MNRLIVTLLTAQLVSWPMAFAAEPSAPGGDRRTVVILGDSLAAGYGLGRCVELILPYPTHREAIKAAAGAYTRTRLTPTAERVLKGLIGITR